MRRKLRRSLVLGRKDELVVIETDVAYLVAFGGDPDDWVAAFAKQGDFPAREWAERMAALYNLREFPNRYLRREIKRRRRKPRDA